MTESDTPPIGRNYVLTDLPPLGRLVKQYMLAVILMPLLTTGLVLAVFYVLALMAWIPALPDSLPALPWPWDLFPEVLPLSLSLSLIAELILIIFVFDSSKSMPARLYVGLTWAPLGIVIAALFVSASSPTTSVVSALGGGIMAGGLFALFTWWGFGRDSVLGCFYVYAAIILLTFVPLAFSPASVVNRLLMVSSGLITFLVPVLLTQRRHAAEPAYSVYAESFDPESDKAGPANREP